MALLDRRAKRFRARPPEAGAATGAARFWDERASEAPVYWASLPDVREYVNTTVCGLPWLFPTHAFKSLHALRPLRKALSIGCGTGALEREIRFLRIAEEVDAFDVSPESIRIAVEEARSQGVDGLRYEVADCDRLAPPAGTYDAVFFHQSLHHISDPDALLDRVRTALRPGGFLYVDEYVGPSRDEWSAKHLEAARRVWGELDPALRAMEVAAPVDARDPSEMIRSSRILPAIRSRFGILYERPYWGNLLFPLICALRGEVLSRPENRPLVRGLVEEERRLTAGGFFREPLFAVVVATRSR